MINESQKETDTDNDILQTPDYIPKKSSKRKKEEKNMKIKS